ncbi:MAG: serine hydrolase domain-containing protein [Dokdonella sp.]
MPTKTLCLLLAFAVAAQAPAHAQTCTFDAAHTRFADFMKTTSLSGGALLIGTSQGIISETYLGSFTAATVVPIASATKLASALRMLQVIERGQADPDAPVATYLPAFSGEKGTMSLRQMFSHTAGYGNDSGADVLLDDGLTLAEAVDQIACCRPLNTGYTVGGQFSYGGISMHIAGRVVEVVGGGDWEQRWQSEIGAPLGITTIDWQGLGPTTNYGIGGSARSNLRDYGRLLQMVANGGRGNNQRILRASTIERLHADNVLDLPIAYAPANANPPVRYSLGAWLDTVPGEALPSFLHSLGAFGFFPWFDRERGLFGVFMIRSFPGINFTALPTYLAMISDMRAEFAANTCVPIEPSDEIFASEFEPY